MKPRTNILLVGAFSSDPSIYTYATSFAQTLHNLGYNIATFNYRAHALPRFFKKTEEHIVNARLISAALNKKPDLIFLIKAETIWSTTLIKIKQATSCTIINFYPDNPFTLWNGNSTTHVLLSLPHIDCFLSWSSLLTTTLYSAGSKHVCSFPFAYDEHIFNSDQLFDEKTIHTYTSDVCFIGTWEPGREVLLANLIEKIPTLNLAIWGNQWDDNCSNEHLRKYIRGGALYKTDMIQAFRAAKIVLNFIRVQNSSGHNMRTFEVPASKSFLLTEYSHDQAHVLFKENESIACFSTREDLICKVKFYLHNPHQRNAIMQQGFNVVQQYSLKKQLESYFQKCPLFNQSRNMYEKGIVRQSPF